MKTAEEIREIISQNIGTVNYWKVSPFKDAPVVTDGVMAVAEHGEAFWLIDEIAGWQADPEISKMPLQVWILTLTDNKGAARLVCEDGNHNVVKEQEICYTNFPLPEGITLYVQYNVILLPGEY